MRVLTNRYAKFIATRNLKAASVLGVSLQKNQSMEQDCIGVLLKSFVMPLVAVFIGAKLAFKNMRKKESIDIETTKYECATKWLLESIECLNNLCALKQRYLSLSGSNAYRSISLRRQSYMFEKFNVSGIESLHFLNSDGIEIERLGFRNFFRIKQLFCTYNRIISSWVSIEETKAEIDNVIANHVRAEGGFEITHELIDEITPIKLSNYIILCESTFSLINDLVNDFYKLTQDFPVIVNEVLDLKLIGKKDILTYIPSDKYLEIIHSTFEKLDDDKFEEVKNITPQHKKWRENQS